MKRLTWTTTGLIFGAIMTVTLGVWAGSTHLGNIIAQDDSTPTCTNHTDNGDICADEDILAEDDITVGDDLIVTDDTTFGDDVEINGNITLENDEVIKNDNNGEIELGNGTEDTAFSWGTNTCVLSSDTGVVELDVAAVGTTIKLANDQTIVSDTNNEIQIGDNSEDISFGFSGTNVVDLSSDTGVVGVDFAAVGTTLTLANDQTIVSDTDNELQFGDNSEDISLGFSTNTITLTTDTGVTKFDFGSTIGVTAGVPALLIKEIRFCGNGPDGGTETFLSPVPFDDTEADFISGGAGCDGEDDTTIANADEPNPVLAQAAFKPVAAICTAICTGATAANDAIVFKLYDDTAALSEATCTTAALGGDATAAQCTWTDTTPETVAAASAIAIGVDNTDDDCNDAGDDFECVVFVTF